jgi:hypothetical protein
MQVEVGVVLIAVEHQVLVVQVEEVMLDRHLHLILIRLERQGLQILEVVVVRHIVLVILLHLIWQAAQVAPVSSSSRSINKRSHEEDHEVLWH